MKYKKAACILLSLMLMLLLGQAAVFAEENDATEPTDATVANDAYEMPESEDVDNTGEEADNTDSDSSLTVKEECDHRWWPDYVNDCCECWRCGATKPHNYINTHVWPADCFSGQTIDKECQDCGFCTSVTLPKYAPHKWSEILWWDMDDEDYYVYGRYCKECDKFQKIVRTVKKGKTKRILPKSFLKKAKKKYVFYNKKKVKATKDGKVKGKKRGSVSTVKWDIKYKNHRGETWWETYEVVIKVK